MWSLIMIASDSGQDWLIELMQKFGLPSSEAGICYGVSHSAMQAKQAGEFERFTQRFTDLRDFSFDEQRINALKDKLAKPEPELSAQEVDFLAFLQTIEIYHQLYVHPELQAEGTLSTEQSAMASLSILKPVAIEKKEKETNKTLSPINSFISAYREENTTGEGFTLENYFEKLKDVFSNSQETVSLILGSGNHIIFVSYDNNNNNWTLVDPERIPNIVTCDNEDFIACAVAEAFKGGHVVFNTTIWGYKDEQLQRAADSINDNLAQDRSNYLSTLNQEEVDGYIDLKDFHGNTQLFVAASFNDIDTVNSLLRENADPDIQNDRNYTALQIAIQNGYEQTAVVLINNDADLDLQDEDGNTPLHLAIQNGQSTVVKQLLKNEANVDLQNSEGLTPLHIAAQSGNDEIVKRLLKADADIGTKSKHGETALLMAATEGHFNVVDRLLEKGATLDFASQPPLVKNQLSDDLKNAVKDGDLNKTKSLLNVGVPPNLNYGPGELPNHNRSSSLAAYAQASKNDLIVQALLDHGAVPSQKRPGPPQKPLPYPPADGEKTETRQKNEGPPKKPLPLPGMVRNMLANSIQNNSQGSEAVAEKTAKEVGSTGPAFKG